MSKNTDFFKLGPYSLKSSIRTGTRTRIRQTERNRAKTAGPRALTRQQCAGSARATRAGRRQSQGACAPTTCGNFCAVAGRPVRFGSARPAFVVRLGIAGDTCRHLARAALLQPTVDACLMPIAALRRSPTDFLFFSFLPSLSSKIRNTVPFSDFHIFRSVDRIDMIPSAKF